MMLWTNNQAMRIAIKTEASIEIPFRLSIFAWTLLEILNLLKADNLLELRVSLGIFFIETLFVTL